MSVKTEANAHHMDGEKTGWYEGHWVDDKGEIGGWIFEPFHFLGYRGDLEEKPTRLSAYSAMEYWDGKNLSKTRPRG